MFFYKAGLTAEVGADTLRRHCHNCNNDTEFILCSAKTGPGIGLPIACLFTQKAILAKKSYFLVCPICEDFTKTTRTHAAELKGVRA